MESREQREQLEKRVAELELQVAGLKRGSGFPFRGIRKQASWGFGGLPFYDIALGPDLARGEIHGRARGVFAFGDMATGVFAMGGFARGVVALGGLAAGILSFGGLSIGVLAAVGGLAVGGLALGGGALGGVAVGGGAAGYYACGAAAAGMHIVDAGHRDPEAEDFFRRAGLMGVCQGTEERRRRGPRPGA